MSKDFYSISEDIGLKFLNKKRCKSRWLPKCKLQFFPDTRVDEKYPLVYYLSESPFC